VATAKLVVDGDGKAWCDIKQYLQSFIKNDQINFNGEFWNPLNDLSFYVNYQVKVAESLGGTEYSDSVRYAFNGQLNFIDFVEYDENNYTTNDDASKFLTNSPRSLYTDFQRTNFLSYLDGANPATKVRIFTYENNNTSPSNVYEKDVDDLTAKGGIISLNETILGFTFLTWENVNENWEDLTESTWESIGSGIINPFVTKLEVYLIDADDNQVSESFYFLKKNYCSKYPKTNVYWQNPLGGFDSFTFNMVKKKKYAIERKAINSYPYTFGASSYSQHNGNILNQANADYFTNYTETVILNSDLLTDAEHAWMFDLIRSHYIYVETLINGVTYYVPASVKETNYEPKIKLVDGLLNVTIELEFGYDNIRITR
jgi:hypothetical protein